jgi:hypothetical protein
MSALIEVLTIDTDCIYLERLNFRKWMMHIFTFVFSSLTPSRNSMLLKLRNPSKARLRPSTRFSMRRTRWNGFRSSISISEGKRDV